MANGDEGTVLLFHGTTIEGALAIARDGEILSGNNLLKREIGSSPSLTDFVEKFPDVPLLHREFVGLSATYKHAKKFSKKRYDSYVILEIAVDERYVLDAQQILRAANNTVSADEFEKASTVPKPARFVQYTLPIFHRLATVHLSRNLGDRLFELCDAFQEYDATFAVEHKLPK